MHCEACGMELDFNREVHADYPGLCGDCVEQAEEDEVARVLREDTRRRMDEDAKYQKETGGP